MRCGRGLHGTEKVLEESPWASPSVELWNREEVVLMTNVIDVGRERFVSVFVVRPQLPRRVGETPQVQAWREVLLPRAGLAGVRGRSPALASALRFTH